MQTSSATGPARRLLGRDQQLAVAQPLIDALAAGRGGLLVLSGAPGIGKTRLADEIVARATSAGARSVWASGWPGDGAPPLWPWVQVLRQLAGSDAALGHDALPTPTSSPALQFEQLEAVASTVVDAASEHPLAIVLDDLHWADPASVRVLLFVASAVRGAPCLLVTTHRPDELPRELAAELARAGTNVALPPLGSDDAAELLRAAVGRDVTPAATDAVLDRSGGNPLFVWEFGQLLAQSGRLDVAPAAVPTAVAAVLERRLARLAEDAVALLRVAAIGGDPFTVAFVAEVAQVPPDDVERRLAGAVADGVIHESASGALSFSHALVRDVVLDLMPQEQRRVLHRRVADVLRDRVDDDPSLHAMVADHLVRAGTEHAADAAAEWELAAREAMTKVAYAEAAVLLGRAGECAVNAGDRARLLVHQGEALLLAGDLVSARERFTDAVASARTLGSAELFARAVLGMGTGTTAWEVPIADETQIGLVQEALAMLPDDERRLRSTLLARLSVAAATPDSQDVARQRAEDALALAEAEGDPVLMGEALAALNDAIAGPTHAMTRRQNADAIVELAMAAGDRALELLGYRFRVVADLETGDVAAVDRDIAAFARVAESLRQPLISWYVPLFRGMRALLAGDADTATRLQADVADAAAATRSQNASLLASTLELGIAIARGEPPPLFVTDVGVDPLEWATYAAGLAVTAYYAGDLAQAADLLDLHARSRFDHVGEDSERMTTLIAFAHVGIGLDRLDAVADLYALLLPSSGLWSVDGIAACCWGPVDLDLGRMALALERIDDARVHLAAARADAERAGAALHVLAADDLLRRCGEQPGSTPAATGDDGNSFRREGQFWSLTFDGSTVRLKDAKGLHDLARLLAEPGRELHVLDLAGAGAAGRAGDLGELLDARARAEYRRRLAELDDELEEAEARGDAARSEKAAVEREFLVAELTAAVGLGGRARRAGDPAERARKAVTGRIRMTIGRIGESHDALARHLDASIRTGTFCAYRPERPTSWTT